MIFKQFKTISIPALAISILISNASVAGPNTKKFERTPFSAKAATSYSIGNRPSQAAKPQQPRPMTPGYFASQCAKYGGGASMNPDGSFKCTKPNGSPGIVPYPIPID